MLISPISKLNMEDQILGMNEAIISFKKINPLDIDLANCTCDESVLLQKEACIQTTLIEKVNYFEAKKKN